MITLSPLIIFKLQFKEVIVCLVSMDKTSLPDIFHCVYNKFIIVLTHKKHHNLYKLTCHLRRPWWISWMSLLHLKYTWSHTCIMFSNKPSSDIDMHIDSNDVRSTNPVQRIYTKYHCIDNSIKFPFCHYGSLTSSITPLRLH